MKKIFDIESHFKKLNNEEKDTLLKVFNDKNKLSITSCIVLMFITLIISFLILLIGKGDITSIIIVVVFFLIFWIVKIIYLVKNLKKMKLNNDEKIKLRIKEKEDERLRKEEEKKREIESLKRNGLYAPDIKRVKLIDSFTQYSDKLHAVLNFQEIIQTRYYKFKVEYFDGSSKIFTVKEDSKEYDIFISFIDNDSQQNNMVVIDNVAEI